MRGQVDRQQSMFVAFDLEQRIPADHPLRPIKAWCDRALAGETTLVLYFHGNAGNREGRIDDCRPFTGNGCGRRPGLARSAPKPPDCLPRLGGYNTALAVRRWAEQTKACHFAVPARYVRLIHCPSSGPLRSGRPPRRWWSVLYLLPYRGTGPARRGCRRPPRHCTLHPPLQAYVRRALTPDKRVIGPPRHSR